jgi:23S rRNA pseudouridine2605 synthase
VKRSRGSKSAAKDKGVRRVGLARALSKLGYCSRQQAAVLIRGGGVRLNGATPRNPETPVRMEVDRIEVQGQAVRAAQKIYLMMNKPRGLVTTAVDEKGRDTVYSLLPPDLSWLAPVGRLDKASEGLLLFTNDSEWGARISDPATHLEKTYHVQIGAVATPELLEAMERGVETVRGEVLQCRHAGLLRSGAKNSWIEVVLDEGKNRQIRLMLDARGMEVLRLLRVAIGTLQLGDLAKGGCRELTAEELIELRKPMRRYGEGKHRCLRG